MGFSWNVANEAPSSRWQGAYSVLQLPLQPHKSRILTQQDAHPGCAALSQTKLWKNPAAQPGAQSNSRRKLTSWRSRSL
jgi:hypothetical protein